MANVRQVPNDYFRRWFCGENFDLMAWYQPDGNLYGFQLTYDKGRDEKTVTCLGRSGVSHRKVDSGEDSPLANRAPILVEVGDRSEMGRVLSDFMASDQDLPLGLKRLVRQKLREYGRLPVPVTE